MARDSLSLSRGESGLVVVVGPGAFITEPKAPAQNVCLTDTVVEDADGGTTGDLRRDRRLALGGIEIEIRLHAAGQDVHVGIIRCPK
jgi:hypothetical protein